MLIIRESYITYPQFWQKQTPTATCGGCDDTTYAITYEALGSGHVQLRLLRWQQSVVLG